jgi:hypothetical protein
MFICAKKRKGKSVLINNLVKWFVDDDTIVYFYVSSFWSDENYEELRQWLDKKGIRYQAYLAIKENGVDNVQVYLDTMKQLQEEQKAKEKEEEEAKRRAQELKDMGHHTHFVFDELTMGNVIPPQEHENIVPHGKMVDVGQTFIPMGPFEAFGPAFGDGFEDPEDNPLPNNEDDESSPEQKKFEVGKTKAIHVFDDLGGTLRAASLTELMKTAFHNLSRVIVSSQNLFDLRREAINMISYGVVFRRLPEDRLEKFREALSFDIKPEHLLKLYTQYTKRDHDFIMMDVLKDELRSNFNRVIYNADEYDAEKEKSTQLTQTVSQKNGNS